MTATLDRPSHPARRSARRRPGGLRIAVIASSRYPIAEPFAGGLEAHVWGLTRALQDLGHRVTLFAAPGSDPALGVEELTVRQAQFSPAARADVSMAPEPFLADHHAYLSLMLALAGPRAADFDIVHNHSLHYLPVAMAATLDIPMVATLHCPPTPWLESALQTGHRPPITFVAVSRHTAAAWTPVTGPVEVVPNGVDLLRWTPGPGGGPLVWSGRIVPEKGPHLAIEAARSAGLPLQLAGPVVDTGYFDREIAPRLGDGVHYLGHLPQRPLAATVGAASAALVTPDWDEPYGLVVAEALACGTPVAAFDRGGVPEVLTTDCGRLVPGGDVPALAAAIGEATALSRAAAREQAVIACSVQSMAASYERIYRSLARAPR